MFLNIRFRVLEVFGFYIQGYNIGLCRDNGREKENYDLGWVWDLGLRDMMRAVLRSS